MRAFIRGASGLRAALLEDMMTPPFGLTFGGFSGLRTDCNLLCTEG